MCVAEVDGATFEGVVSDLLNLSHLLHPERVVPEVGARLVALGLTDPVIYLVDVDQRLLVPVEGEGSLVIDATLAGRAFRTETILEGATDDPEAGGGRRLWVPLLDGAERVGVMAVTVDH